MENKDRPAFAHNNPKMAEQVGRGISERDHQTYTSGLTKREYFAGLALQGIMSQVMSDPQRIIDEITTNGNPAYRDKIAIAAVRIADELLKQLECAPLTEKK